MPQNYSGAKGRSKTATFFRFPKEVLHSKQYAALGGWEVKLIADFGAMYNGKNNGDFSAAWVIMSERGWKSKGTLYKAIKATMKAGFVTVTRQGGRNKTSLYALTFIAIDHCEGKLDVSETKRPPNFWKKKK